MMQTMAKRLLASGNVNATDDADRYNELYGFGWDPITGHGTLHPSEIGSSGWAWATAITSFVGLFSNWVLFWGIVKVSGIALPKI